MVGALGCALVGALGLVALPLAHSADSVPRVQLFIDAASKDEEQAERAMAALAEAWKDSYTALLVDVARFMAPRRESRMTGRMGTVGGRSARLADSGGFSRGITGSGGGGGGGGRGGGGGGGAMGSLPGLGDMPRQDESYEVRRRLVNFLEEQTGQDFGEDLSKWRRWYWSLPYEPHPGYTSLKQAMYERVDDTMGVYFDNGGAALVRLDEVLYGGRPPKRSPILEKTKHVEAGKADFLKDKDRVIGLEVRGKARAYPASILALHEIARDTLGGVDLTIVTDFLVGTSIVYGSSIRGADLTFRPSGLVYRSNRMMLDQESVTLWSSLQGRAVLGPLTEHDVWLKVHPSVHTTWKEWRTLHPDTSVLSPDTGFPEEAYERASRFADRYTGSSSLAFDVPQEDDRLDNKDLVVGVELAPKKKEEGPRRPRALALRSKFLDKRENRVFGAALGERNLVVVTSDEGAHRVYDAGDTTFTSQLRDGRLQDEGGGTWLMYESVLVPEGANQSPRSRVPSRLAYWFAWRAQFPRTDLVK